MLRQVAREPQQFFGDGGGAADFRTVRIQARLADMVVRHTVAVAAPDRARQGRGDVIRQAQGLADLADRHARAVVDHRRDDRGLLTPVAGVDVLHHLLAPLVLEIDVDVRRLAALFRDEAGEQQILVLLGGIHRRDPKTEADAGVGGRAAALAQDVLLARPADDVVDGQEIVGELELLDQIQFVGDQLRHLVRHAARIAPFRARPGQLAQAADGRLALRHWLVGVFVGQLRQVDADAFGDFDAALDRAGEFREQPRHLGR